MSTWPLSQRHVTTVCPGPILLATWSREREGGREGGEVV